VRLERVGSKSILAALERVDHLEACADVISAPSPIPTSAMTSSVQTVERTDLSLVHSEARTPRSP
jgi:hypothetical protein